MIATKAISREKEPVAAGPARPSSSLPRTIQNNRGGYKVTFHKSAADTAWAYLDVEVETGPNGGNDLHYHTTFLEHFEALNGNLHVQVEQETLVLRPGQTCMAPLLNHRFFNPDPENTITFRVVVQPARQFEQPCGRPTASSTTAKPTPRAS